jgi:hypothetical protein
MSGAVWRAVRAGWMQKPDAWSQAWWAPALKAGIARVRELTKHPYPVKCYLCPPDYSLAGRRKPFAGVSV